MKKKLNKKILNYNAVFTHESEGGFSVLVPSLPGCYSQGETLTEAVKNIQEAIELYLTDDAKIRVDRKTSDPRVGEFIVPVQIYVG